MYQRNLIAYLENVPQFAQARKNFEFNIMAQRVILAHRPQATNKGLQLTLESDPEIDNIGGTFIGDEMRIRQGEQ